MAAVSSGSESLINGHARTATNAGERDRWRSHRGGRGFESRNAHHPLWKTQRNRPVSPGQGQGLKDETKGPRPGSATTHRLSPDRAADPTVSGTLQSSGLDGPTRSEETVGDLTVHRSKPVPDAAIPQEVARPREPQRQPGRRPESLVDTLRMMRSTIRPTGHELIPDSGSTRRCRADHERRDAPTRRWSISPNWLQNSSRRSVEPAQPH